MRLDGVSETNSDALRLYKRYAKRWDDRTFDHYNSVFQPRVEYGGSKAEVNAKVEIWAAAMRPR